MPASAFIVWDWNCTLLADFDLNVRGSNQILQHFGKPPIDADRFRETFEVPISRFYRNNGVTEEELAEDPEGVQHIYHAYYDSEARHTPLREGGHEVLSDLQAQGLRQLILSNHLVTAIRADLERLGIAPLIPDVLAFAHAGEQAVWSRPKGDRLKAFLEHQNLDPRNGVIIGDTPEETHIARSLGGMVSIAITGGFASEQRLREAQPDYLIHSLEAIPGILRERGMVAP